MPLLKGVTHVLLSGAAVVIAVVLSLIVLSGAYSGEQPFVWLENMRVGADIFQKIATAIALIIGGIFAWHKFIRRGEHDPRLQGSVTGTATTRGEVTYIVAVATVQNSGQVDVDLDLDSSGLEAFTITEDSDEWSFYSASEIFEDHDVVQPGETIEDQVWIELDEEDAIGFALRLTVAEEVEGFSWETYEMIVLAPSEGG